MAVWIAVSVVLLIALAIYTAEQKKNKDGSDAR